MTTRELIEKLSQVAPDTEVIGGIWNGKVDTYTVLDIFLKMPYDGVYADFFGTPGAFDLRMMDIKSPEVIYLGSTFEESDPRLIDDRRFLHRLAAIRRQHRSTQWKKDRIYRLMQEFDKQ